jgi:hypothetical protein
MRSKGMPYKINFGVSLFQLKQIAAHYLPDAELAGALWREEIRESRLLATFLQPCENFKQEEALQWLAEADTPELVDFLCMNLLQCLPYTPALTIFLIKKDDVVDKRKGYALSNRLFSGKNPPAEAWQEEFLKNAVTDCLSDNISVSSSAIEALKCAVRDEKRGQRILSFFDVGTPLREELQFEYDYYCRRFSDVKE